MGYRNYILGALGAMMVSTASAGEAIVLNATPVFKTETIERRVCEDNVLNAGSVWKSYYERLEATGRMNYRCTEIKRETFEVIDSYIVNFLLNDKIYQTRMAKRPASKFKVMTQTSIKTVDGSKENWKQR